MSPAARLMCGLTPGRPRTADEMAAFVTPMAEENRNSGDTATFKAQNNRSLLQ